jgi:hypothetical protein
VVERGIVHDQNRFRLRPSSAMVKKFLMKSSNTDASVEPRKTRDSIIPS